MFGNPTEKWQRLTAHYREMNDVELCELAADMADLTEVAQGVLSATRCDAGIWMWVLRRLPDAGDRRKPLGLQENRFDFGPLARNLDIIVGQV